MAKRTDDEKNKNNSIKEKREHYKDKIYKHKMSAIYRIILVVAVVLVLGFIVYRQYKNHVYTSYDTISMTPLDVAGNSKCMRLGENVLFYSSDGMHCMNTKGEILWNQTFEMQNMLISTNEDTVAVAEHNGHEIYVLDCEQKICEIKTPMPIREISVSETAIPCFRRRYSAASVTRVVIAP